MAVGNKPDGGHTAGPHTPPRGIGEPCRHLVYRDSAIADANGVATLTLQIDAEFVGWIDRIAVSTDSAGAAQLDVYDGDAADANLVDFTPAGNRAVSDESSPIRIPAAGRLTLQWTSADVGATCIARVQYRLEPRGA